MAALIPRKIAKVRCVCCGECNQITKEHYWPRWLIKKCKCQGSSFPTESGHRATPMAITVPLCKDCNFQLGSEIEAPVGKIISRIESGDGLSDIDADVLVRWLWKFESLSFLLKNGYLNYSISGISMHERVFRPLGEIRSEVCLAIARIQKLHPESKDFPIGICSMNRRDSIFVSGVFSMISIFVAHVSAITRIPQNYTVYQFLPQDSRIDRSAHLCFPKFGFTDDVEAVGRTRLISIELDAFHEALIDGAKKGRIS